MKKVKAFRQNEKDDQVPTSVEILPIVISSRSFFSHAPVLPNSLKRNAYAVCEPAKTVDRSVPVFHPPGA